MALSRVAAIARELSYSSRLLVAVAIERHLRGENVVRIEAGTDTVQGNEGADQQCRTDQQNHSQRDLSDHQKRADLALAESSAGAVAAFLQGRVQVSARGGEGREKTKKNAGEQRYGKGKGEHAPIERIPPARESNTLSVSN